MSFVGFQIIRISAHWNYWTQLTQAMPYGASSVAGSLVCRCICIWTTLFYLFHPKQSLGTQRYWENKQVSERSDKDSFCERDSSAQASSRRIHAAVGLQVFGAGEPLLPQAYNRYQDSPCLLFSPRQPYMRCVQGILSHFQSRKKLGFHFLSSFRGGFGPKPPTHCSCLFSLQVFSNYTHLFSTSPFTRRFLWSFRYNNINEQNPSG